MNSLDQNIRAENLLSAYLNAMHTGKSTEHLTQNASAEMVELLNLTDLLHSNLIPIEPSPEFLLQLRGEFITHAPPALLLRWRKIPPRYRIAAQIGGVTLTAGLALLAGRRAFDLLHGIRSRQTDDSDGSLSVNSLS